MPFLMTAPIQEPMTVFLVGVQCRSLRSTWKLPFIGRRMAKMQEELLSDPESGLIWGANFIQLRPLTTLYLSYWRSSEHIHRFVESSRFSHKTAAPEYFRRFGSDPHLGVWHETYEINPDKAETLYYGMNPFGASAFIPPVKLTPETREFMNRLKRGTGGSPA